MARPTNDPRYQTYSTNDGSYRASRENGWQQWDGNFWKSIAPGAVPKGLQGSVPQNAPAVYSPSTFNSANIDRSERPRSATEMLREQQDAARNSMGSQVNPNTPLANRTFPSGMAGMGYSPANATGYVSTKSPDYQENAMMNGQMNAGMMQPPQTARQQMVDQRNAAGRANVLQRFANANQKMQAMGATANMPRINDVGYGGSPRGVLPPNKQGQGGINNTALMGPGAQPTFRYGVNQNISMPAGSSPGTSAMGYGGSSRPTQGQFGGFQGAQAGGHAPPGMYAQGWQPQQPLPQRMGAGSPGMPGASGGMSGRPMQGQFGTPQPRLANPSWSGISPYVR